MKLPNFTRPLYGLGEHNKKNFLFLFLNFIGTVLSDLTQKISPTIGKLDRKIRSMKFETVRIHFLNISFWFVVIHKFCYHGNVT